jgi:hypothetical protein
MNINLLTLDEAPDPTTTTILVAPDDSDPDFLFVRGAGHVRLMCGGCSRALAQGLASAGDVSQIVFQCPGCQRYNRTRN